MRRNILVILFFNIIFISCNDNSIDNNEDLLTLNVQVVDSNNIPLKNINVSIWANINSNTVLKKPSQNNVTDSTTIIFDLPQSCFVSMIMYSLNDKIIDKVISKELQTGAYAYTWTTSIPNGVFKCKFIASSDSVGNIIFFRDSIYVVLIAPDPSISSIGKTDANGNISTSDKLLFPNLYNLPSIPLTSFESPDIIGHFTFSDSVTIALSDESFSNEKLYYREIRNGANKFSLNWDDGIIRSENQKIINENKYANGVVKNLVIIPKDWKLYQNYPNPFN